MNKPPPWLIGVFVGSFIYGLKNDPDSLHFPEQKRREAAHSAQGRALSHWQVWCSIVFLILATITLSLFERWLGVFDDKNGTAGAAIGFFLGLAAIQWAIYYCGLPYYRAALRPRENKSSPHGSISTQ